jgi:hypothetical protein
MPTCRFTCRRYGRQVFLLISTTKIGFMFKAFKYREMAKKKNFTDIEIKSIINEYFKGFSTVEVGKKFSITGSNVFYILKKITYKDEVFQRVVV